MKLLCLLITALLLTACSGQRSAPTSVATTASSAVGSPTVSTSAGSAELTASPAPTATPTAESATTKRGWWIRINPTATTAPTITLQIGTDKLNREEWRVWRTGEPTEFAVPDKYAQAPRLYLRGSVTPIGRQADLCLMYQNHGVEHLGFDDDEAETKRQTAVDYKCRP